VLPTRDSGLLAGSSLVTRLVISDPVPPGSSSVPNGRVVLSI